MFHYIQHYDDPDHPYFMHQPEYFTRSVHGASTRWYEFTNNSDKPVIPASVITVEGTQLSCEALGIVTEDAQSYDVEVPAGETVSLLFCTASKHFDAYITE